MASTQPPIRRMPMTAMTRSQFILLSPACRWRMRVDSRGNSRPPQGANEVRPELWVLRYNGLRPWRTSIVVHEQTGLGGQHVPGVDAAVRDGGGHLLVIDAGGQDGAGRGGPSRAAGREHLRRNAPAEAAAEPLRRQRGRPDGKRRRPVA